MKTTHEILTEAILAEYRKYGRADQESILKDALRRISSDTNMVAFAMELGIDTDKLLNPEHEVLS